MSLFFKTIQNTFKVQFKHYIMVVLFCFVLLVTQIMASYVKNVVIFGGKSLTILKNTLLKGVEKIEISDVVRQQIVTSSDQQ